MSKGKNANIIENLPNRTTKSHFYIFYIFKMSTALFYMHAYKYISL